MRTPFLVLGFLLILVLAVIRIADPGPLVALREAGFDLMQRIAPRAPPDLPVRVVDIDERSLAEIGQWPWPRDTVADLVDRLAGYGAAVVVFDVLFAEPDRMSPARLAESFREQGFLSPTASAERLATLDTDLGFAASLQGMPTVLGLAMLPQGAPPPDAKAGFVELGATPSAGILPLMAAVSPLPVLAADAAGLGVISIDPMASAAVVRRVPLIWRTGTEGQMMPSLSVEGLRVALGETTFLLRGAADVPGLPEALQLGGFSVPLTERGEIWVRYRPDDPALYVPAAAVLAPGEDAATRARIEGHIVLVGTSAAGLLDIRTTALGQNVPGVSIHAQVIEQVLSGNYLRRDALTEAAEVASFVFLGLIVVVVMSMAGPVWSIVAGAVAGGAMTGASWFAFTERGLLFDATFPVIGGFLAFAGVAAWQFIVADRDKRMIRRSFAHYVAPAILTEIEGRGHRLELGGVTKPVTIMFCDIRNFTPMAAGLSATALVDLLNRLFTDLGDEILAEQGTIDKFIGDAVMAFWNAPLDMADHPRRAVQAALRLRGALARFNAANAGQQDGPKPVALAIGVATGMACVGNIGSRQRFNYTAVGDTVNLAARIETACRHVDCDILLAADTARHVRDFALLDAGALSLKGVAGRLDAAVLVGSPALAATPGFRALEESHLALLRAIRDGDAAGIGAHLDTCRHLVAAVEPGLQGFYERLERRLDDYR
jgi:adenylate cyclase